MFQAGLAAERGLGIYKTRLAGKLEEPQYLEPLWEERNTIFFMTQTPRHPSAFAETLYSELRIFGEDPVRCVQDPSKGLLLQWTNAGKITLASGFPMKAEGEGLECKHLLGYTMITARSPGLQSAKLDLPKWIPALPAYVPPPRYSEPVN
jgi:hypothetical protein